MEIKKAIKSLKNNKDAGPDNIPTELIIADIDNSAKAFLPLITKKWNDKLCPDDWNYGLDPLWKLQRDHATVSTWSYP